ncbi:hypothetical protein NEMBOFW57_002749 [Staphylotrichum longicolle]|uniref:Uncharacterized protein n=1 Tax=Staphylotrichum longicolle TaxID=669026 RepID=A0AAD4I2R3_9PEZI|nr:hypothetical protein NEMBOFW57_002749 [Staphylotrichum longicolle]
MVLKRWQICRLLGFNSWTAIQVWLDDVVRPASQELNRDYLAPFEARGERNPPGDRHTKEFFVRFAEDFDRVVERRVTELEQGVQSHPRKNNWGTRQHYKHFIVEALALDRRSAMRSPEKSHIADREWAEDPVKLFANMYELTEALCHNYWKPAETEMWASDDSDVPYTDGDDVPGALL